VTCHWAAPPDTVGSRNSYFQPNDENRAQNKYFRILLGLDWNYWQNSCIQLTECQSQYLKRILTYSLTKWSLNPSFVIFLLFRIQCHEYPEICLLSLLKQNCPGFDRFREGLLYCPGFDIGELSPCGHGQGRRGNSMGGPPLFNSRIPKLTRVLRKTSFFSRTRNKTRNPQFKAQYAIQRAIASHSTVLIKDWG